MGSHKDFLISLDPMKILLKIVMAGLILRKNGAFINHIGSGRLNILAMPYRSNPLVRCLASRKN